MAIQINLYQGTEALSLLENEEFLIQWQDLAKADPKDTHLQEGTFVKSWYQVYQSIFHPLILVGSNLAGDTIGLMFLSQHHKSGKLVHAGNEQAEYHGWISRPADNQAFLLACLFEVKTQLSINRWTWQWMPRRVDLSEIAVQELKKRGIYLTYESQAVPYWNLKEVDKLKKLLKSRSFKSKVNRYKRRGNLRLEKIESPEKFQAILPDLAFQTDIRKEATYNASPFADDKNKGAFMLQMIRHSQNHHCTALFLDDKPIAIHFGTEDGIAVHLGTISYDPSESRQSPGTILMVLLGELLQKEGFQYMDLTPGTDAYKLRFSNEFIQHIKPSFYFSKPQFYKGKLKNWGVTKLKSLVLKYGDPQRFRIKIADIKENIQKLKSQPNVWLKSKIKAISNKSNKLRSIEINPELIRTFSPNTTINHQCYQDLFLYPRHLALSRRGIFAKALSHFQAGDQLFTHLQSEKLQIIIWQINFANKKVIEINPHYQELADGDRVLRIGYWAKECPFSNIGPLLASILQSRPQKKSARLFLECSPLLGKVPTEIENLVLQTPSKP